MARLRAILAGALLLLGWLEALSLSVRGIAWLANPCFLLGTILLAIRRFGLATIAFGLAIGLRRRQFQSHIGDDRRSGDNEAAVVGLGSGFWLWTCAMLLGLMASTVMWVMALAVKDSPVDAINGAPN